MISSKGLIVHLAALGVATILAVIVWTKEDAPKVAKEAEVEVWGGKADGVSAIAYESKDKTVKLTAKKDSVGQWFVGQVDKTTTLRKPATLPDGGLVEGGAPPPPVLEKKEETTTFVAVEQAQKLAEKLAPLMAIRALGKVDDARAEEFGFHEPEGTVRVTVGGKEHTLIIGGATPGGGDRYAKVEETGQVYAVPGSIAQDLMFAESRLIERDLFGFEDDELAEVRVEKGDQSRELVRMDEQKKRAWADKASPTSQDETATNWMTQIARLRVMKYVEKLEPEPTPEQLIVRVKYVGKGGRPLGELTLYKLPGSDGKPSFVVHTNHIRWYAEVIGSTAEQIEQDLSSVLK